MTGVHQCWVLDHQRGSRRRAWCAPPEQGLTGVKSSARQGAAGAIGPVPPCQDPSGSDLQARLAAPTRTDELSRVVVHCCPTAPEVHLVQPQFRGQSPGAAYLVNVHDIHGHSLVFSNDTGLSTSYLPGQESRGLTSNGASDQVLSHVVRVRSGIRSSGLTPVRALTVQS